MNPGGKPECERGKSIEVDLAVGEKLKVGKNTKYRKPVLVPDERGNAQGGQCEIEGKWEKKLESRTAQMRTSLSGGLGKSSSNAKGGGETRVHKRRGRKKDQGEGTIHRPAKKNTRGGGKEKELARTWVQKRLLEGSTTRFYIG